MSERSLALSETAEEIYQAFGDTDLGGMHEQARQEALQAATAIATLLEQAIRTGTDGSPGVRYRLPTHCRNQSRRNTTRPTTAWPMTTSRRCRKPFCSATRASPTPVPWT